MNKIPNIALVGNAPQEKYDVLNSMLAEEDLTDLCSITLYGADGQPELEALHDAIEDYRRGEVQGIVCLPMAQTLRESLMRCINYDTTELLTLEKHDKTIIASVKGQVSVGDAAATLTKEDIIEKAQRLTKALKRDEYILSPRIVVMSLNNEIATNETSEEINIIAPAVSELVKSGIQVFGPVAAGIFFDNDDYKAYDAILEMYDDQVIEKFRNLSDDTPVSIASGIDIPITTSEAEGILHCIFEVLDIIKNRQEYDIPFKNPLPKLYHEKKEGGDKARFTVKKKGFNPAEHRRENVNYITKRAVDTDDKAEKTAE